MVDFSNGKKNSESGEVFVVADFSERDVDWSKLPEELLQIVLSWLTKYNIFDHILFSSVCTSWRKIALERPSKGFLPPQIPCLLIHAELYVNPRKRWLLNISNNKLFPVLGKLQDLELGGFSRVCQLGCYGFSQGFLFMIDKNKDDIILVNPLTGFHLNLPSLFTIPDFHVFNTSHGYVGRTIYEFALSTHPTLGCPENCVVMAICYGRPFLIFCRPGDTSWSIVEHECQSTRYYIDVLYFNGQFYAVDCYNGNIVVCDLGPFPRIKDIISPKTPDETRARLVESCGELWLVHSYCDWDLPGVSFKIFKRDGLTLVWSELQNIGDCTLFISCRTSVCVNSSCYPGLKGNCIYYTGFEDEVCGMYNLSDGSFEPFQGRTTENVDWSDAMWATLTPW